MFIILFFVKNFLVFDVGSYNAENPRNRADYVRERRICNIVYGCGWPAIEFIRVSRGHIPNLHLYRAKATRSSKVSKGGRYYIIIHNNTDTSILSRCQAEEPIPSRSNGPVYYYMQINRLLAILCKPLQLHLLSSTHLCDYSKIYTYVVGEFGKTTVICSTIWLIQ